MNPWYIVGLAVGIGLIIYGLVKIGSGVSHPKPSSEVSKEKPQITGRLDDVSPADAKFILAKSIELLGTHGYNDLLGMLADRASGVALNELPTRPCSQCGIPRNQRGKHNE